MRKCDFSNERRHLCSHHHWGAVWSLQFTEPLRHSSFHHESLQHWLLAAVFIIGIVISLICLPWSCFAPLWYIFHRAARLIFTKIKSRRVISLLKIIQWPPMIFWTKLHLLSCYAGLFMALALAGSPASPGTGAGSPLPSLSLGAIADTFQTQGAASSMKTSLVALHCRILCSFTVFPW